MEKTTYIMRNLTENEMGGACSTYGGGERHVKSSGGENWGKETSGETQA
jgi:hypothetical protein